MAITFSLGTVDITSSRWGAQFSRRISTYYIETSVHEFSVIPSDLFYSEEHAHWWEILS